MKKYILYVVLGGFFMFSSVTPAFALGETGTTVVYRVTHTTPAGTLSTYASYRIVAHEKHGYWLQRTITLTPESAPLSVTQTLFDDFTHEPLRYIMHRPAKMGRPENVIDLPLSKMGKDEILPVPGGKPGANSTPLQTDIGVFETREVVIDGTQFWLSLQIPVLGVVKAATEEWTMEVVRISQGAEDLLPKKPPQGGIVYLNN